MPNQLALAIRSIPVRFWVLLGIAILGFILRVHGLTFQSLWNDELSTVMRSRYETVADVIRLGVVTDVHPPGHFLLMHFVMSIFGESTAAIRWPSAVMGTLCVPALYGLGRRLYGIWEGLVAASLMAVLWLPIYYSQDGRPYAMMMLAAILSSHALLVVCQRQHLGAARWPAVGFVLSAVVCAYTHYFGLLFVVVQGIVVSVFYVGSRRFREGRAVLGLFLLCALAYVPWLPSMWEQLDRKRSIAPPTPDLLPEYARFMFNESGALTSAVLTTCVFWAATEWGERRASPSVRKPLWSTSTMALVCWVTLPFVIAYAQSLVMHPVLRMRNLAVCAPAAYLLLARGLARIGPTDTARTTLAVVAVLASLSQLVLSREYYSRPTKDQFHQATRYVVDNFKDRPDTAIIASAYNVRYVNFMFEQHGSPLRAHKRRFGKPGDLPHLDRYLKKEKPKHLWYVVAKLMPHRRLLKRIRRDYHQTKHARLIQAGAYLFERKRQSGLRADAP